MNRFALLLALMALVAGVSAAQADCGCAQTAYYQPSTVYYAAPATTVYYAAAPTTAYYAPAAPCSSCCAAPATTTAYYAPSTAYYAAAPRVAYYPATYGYYTYYAW